MLDLLRAYWSPAELAANGLILLHLLGALALGLLIGYERSFHGRAAGMRTYALVCLASTVLTVVNAYPGAWFAGVGSAPAAIDPTRVVQGIMTGVGFLGAGVIMREGMTIKGLSTAASIWLTAAVGVVLGLGLYAAAIATAVLSVTVMGGFRRLEAALPHRSVMQLTVSCPRHRGPSIESVRALVQRYGFEVTDRAFRIPEGGTKIEYQLGILAHRNGNDEGLARALADADDVCDFLLAPARS